MKKITNRIKFYLDALLGLLYPNYCPGCGNSLVMGEKYICMQCVINLPYTYFKSSRKNVVSELLMGRFKFQKASSLCYFVKGGRLQKLLHNLKYEHKPQIGIELGIYLGNDLIKNGLTDFDVIVPVPLHHKKKKIRGYNQSEAIAEGITRAIDKPIDVKSIERVIFTDTQTKKDKFQRWDNVKDIFEIKYPENLKNKHILIVDDVITTGATIEALARKIETIENVKISVACVAIAKKM